MFKIKIVIDRGTKEVAEGNTLEVDSLQNGAPVLHRVAHAVRRAPGEHRVATFVVFAGLWVFLEFFLHMEAAAHTVEIFGVVPFADNAAKFFMGIKE
jgi:hypothetical protein